MTDETIFAAALGKSDPAERAAFLAEACGGDAERRQRLEALLAAHAAAADFLESPAAAALDCDAGETRTVGPERGAPVGGDEEPLTFLTPSTRPDSLGRIGHYEVLQILGRGGFGIVFRAFDEVLQRVVALKVMAPQLAATSPARKRFLREARSSAQVRHENVVQVYEVAEQPLPYLAMEFIPGETLQQRLDRTGPLDVPEVLRIGRQIAEGLAAAHATDLIHRDIKPANVLLEGGQQKVKITDFGLARAADDASISQSGIIAGTPMYMAPEQAKGETLDQRADLFSLGSVLYQMTSGRPPFRANTTVAVLKRVADDAPRPIREIIPETPQWLCDIIAKLHAKNPDERYQSAREVADVLADCEAQLKAHAKVKDFSRIPRGKPRRSGRWKWAAAAAVLVVIGVSLIWWRGWVNEFFGARPPSATGTTAGPAVSRKVAWGDVVDPLGDCRFVEEDGRLTIEVPGGPKRHDLTPQPDGTNLTAPRVLREVEGDFDARVTVSDWTPGGPLTSRIGPPYVTAGLVVWQDESHFLRLSWTTDPPAQAEFHPGWMYTDVDLFWGAGESHHVRWDDLYEKAHLRIRRVNGVLFVAQSSNGLNWIDEAAVTGFSCTGPVCVGVVAISTVFQDFTPEFEGFEVKGLPTSPGLPNAPPLFVAPFTDADVQRIAALPAEKQVEEVRKELMRRNPGFDGKLETKIEDGVVTDFRIVTDHVTDIAPIRALTRLQKLEIHGSGYDKGALADLSPLKGMPLKWLNIGENKVSDLTPLTGMPLEWLAMWQWRGADLTPLKGMPLKWLNGGGGGQKFDLTSLAGMPLEYLCINYTQVSDLRPLKGAPLRDLECANTPVSDLSPLKGMRLARLLCQNTQLSNLSPLQGMPLDEIRLTPKNITQGLDILRDMKTLTTIGISFETDKTWPAAEFWERYDKGEFKQ